MVRSWALAVSACLIPACVHPNEPAYLTGSEIERLVIGRGLEEADGESWKESFLPGEGDGRAGRILGRSRSSPPYAGTWALEGDRICVDYGDERGCYRLAMEQGNRVLWFDADGNLGAESTLVEADRPGDAARGLLTQQFQKETVRFRHGEDLLVGDLGLPAGPAPHPAILFVHGSGPGSRHSSFYEPMKDEFLRRGFATLIWSKPGVDESTGDYLEQSMDQRAGEVEAAMAHLAARADIDADRIGLWGGSQAGWVVPKLAARREVAFMILVSCAADDAMSQMLYLAGNLLARLGVSEGERPAALDDVRSYYELIRSSGSHEEFLRAQEALLAAVKQRPWYARIERPAAASEAWLLDPDSAWVLRPLPIDRKRFQFLHGMFVDDAPPRLDVLRAPLLAIYGTRDIVVDWKLGSRAYEGVARLAGNSDVTVELIEGADHSLLQPDREGYLDFAPGVLTTMGEWLSQRR